MTSADDLFFPSRPSTPSFSSVRNRLSIVWWKSWKRASHLLKMSKAISVFLRRMLLCNPQRSKCIDLEGYFLPSFLLASRMKRDSHFARLCASSVSSMSPGHFSPPFAAALLQRSFLRVLHSLKVVRAQQSLLRVLMHAVSVTSPPSPAAMSSRRTTWPLIGFSEIGKRRDQIELVVGESVFRRFARLSDSTLLASSPSPSDGVSGLSISAISNSPSSAWSSYSRDNTTSFSDTAGDISTGSLIAQLYPDLVGDISCCLFLCHANDNNIASLRSALIMLLSLCAAHHTVYCGRRTCTLIKVSQTVSSGILSQCPLALHYTVHEHW